MKEYPLHFVAHCWRPLLDDSFLFLLGRLLRVGSVVVIVIVVGIGLNHNWLKNNSLLRRFFDPTNCCWLVPLTKIETKGVGMGRTTVDTGSDEKYDRGSNTQIDTLFLCTIQLRIFKTVERNELHL